jgi:hypothetical protein
MFVARPCDNRMDIARLCGIGMPVVVSRPTKIATVVAQAWPCKSATVVARPCKNKINAARLCGIRMLVGGLCMVKWFIAGRCRIRMAPRRVYDSDLVRAALATHHNVDCDVLIMQNVHSSRWHIEVGVPRWSSVARQQFPKSILVDDNRSTSLAGVRARVTFQHLSVPLPVLTVTFLCKLSNSQTVQPKKPGPGYQFSVREDTKVSLAAEVYKMDSSRLHIYHFLSSPDILPKYCYFKFGIPLVLKCSTRIVSTGGRSSLFATPQQRIPGEILIQKLDTISDAQLHVTLQDIFRVLRSLWTLRQPAQDAGKVMLSASGHDMPSPALFFFGELEGPYHSVLDCYAH